MFSINEQLINDTHYLVEKNGFHLLLHKNATIPWLIIVPVTAVLEVFELSQPQQQDLNDLIKEISTYLQQKFSVTKMNIAAIGNIVLQLHIHVIGRKKGDACWPDVVWGNEYPIVEWHTETIKQIQSSLLI